MTRHRPRVLWIGPGRLPVAVCCDEHFWQPQRLNRPLPCRPTTQERAA